MPHLIITDPSRLAECYHWIILIFLTLIIEVKYIKVCTQSTDHQQYFYRRYLEMGSFQILDQNQMEQNREEIQEQRDCTLKRIMCKFTVNLKWYFATYLSHHRLIFSGTLFVWIVYSWKIAERI